MTHATVINCSLKWKLKCPMRWDAFVRTGRYDVRFCANCQKMVYLCETPEAVALASKEGRCMAVPTADAGPGYPEHFVGIPG